MERRDLRARDLPIKSKNHNAGRCVEILNIMNIALEFEPVGATYIEAGEVSDAKLTPRNDAHRSGFNEVLTGGSPATTQRSEACNNH